MARIIFFGNERLSTGFKTSTPTLKALLAAGHEVVAIVSNFSSGQAKTRSSRELEIAEVAEAQKIPLLLPSKVKDIIEDLKIFKADTGVLVAFGQIVPESVIEIFPRGIVNIHPSLLPLHRGPIPVESVILNGEKETGVSIMKLVKAMDAGPIYGQVPLHLSGNETKQELTEKLLEIGSKTLIELLPGILNGSIAPKPQDGAKATYDPLLKKTDGLIDWNKPAEQIEREIRAYAGWPKSYTSLGGKEVIITKANIIKDESAMPGKIRKSDKALMVGTEDGYLNIQTLKPIGKNEMSVEDFIRGYGNDLA